MLTPEEQAELDALEAEFNPQARMPAAPNRKPGDLQNMNIQVLSPEEEAELVALEQEFGERNLNPEPQGFMDTLGNVVTSVGETVDSYTGAPSRSAVDAIVSGKNPVSAFANQFGDDPNKAPTFKETAIKLGFDDSTGRVITNPKTGITSRTTKSDADIVGFAGDMLVDWTNALPFAGTAAKGLGKGTKWALKGSAKASDAAAGTKFVKAGEIASDTAKATTEATKNAKTQLVKLFRPDVAPDFKELSEIMAKNGIDIQNMPEAVEFGENSMISRMARNKAEGPLGGEALQKFEKFSQEITNATDNNIAKIGGGNVVGKQEAGRVLREGFDEGVKSFFDQMDITYNSIIDMNPGIKLIPESKELIDTKMNGIEKMAKGLTKRGITATDRSQGKELLNAVAAYRNAGTSLKQQKEAMNMIGRAAFKSSKSGAELPSDVRSLREMYFSLQRGFAESTRAQLGDEIADALISNNKAMSQHFTERGPIARILESAKSDEEVFDALITRGNSKQVEALKSILPAEKFNQLKASYLDSLINRNADGVINFETTRKKLNLKKDQLKNIYSLDELKEVDELLRLGDRAGKPVLSSSGTGASNMFSNIKGYVQDAIGGDVMLEGMKNSARKRANYVEVPNSAPSGKPVSGMQMLREKASKTKDVANAGVRGAQEKSVQERNEKIKKLKQIRGL
jgi:hypothetical protein